MLRKCLGALLVLAATQVQAQVTASDSNCLNSAVLRFVEVGSPQQNLLLSFKLQPNGKPLSPGVEQSSGQADVDQLALILVERCSYPQAGNAQGQAVKAAMAVDESVFAPDKVLELYDKVRAMMLNQRDYHVYLIETASEEAAHNVLSQLATSEFEVVARKESQARSARYGGNLGWTTSESFAEPLAKVLIQGKWPALHPQPVKVKDRWYVISVSEVRPAQIPKLEDVSDKLRRSLLLKRPTVVAQP